MATAVAIQPLAPRSGPMALTQQPRNSTNALCLTTCSFPILIIISLQLPAHVVDEKGLVRIIFISLLAKPWLTFTRRRLPQT